MDSGNDDIVLCRCGHRNKAHGVHSMPSKYHLIKLAYFLSFLQIFLTGDLVAGSRD